MSCRTPGAVLSLPGRRGSNVLQKPYKASHGSDQRPSVEGPGNGMGYDSGTLWPSMRFSSDQDAEAGALCANEAYRMGYLHAQADMRRALGLEKI